MNNTLPSEEQREHFLSLLKQFDTAMLVTHAGGEKLRARPMMVAKIEPDCRLWFITGSDSGKVQEMQSDSSVHVVCQKDTSAYLSMSGRASLLKDRAMIEEVWQEPFRAWFPGGKNDPKIELIVVTPEEGEYWDNGGMQKIKYLTAAVKAYATGEKVQVDEGEQHGHVTL